MEEKWTIPSAMRYVGGSGVTSGGGGLQVGEGGYKWVPLGALYS